MEEEQKRQYVVDLFAAEDGPLQQVHRDIENQELPAISIGPDEGRILSLLARSVGAAQMLEIGALAGYSGIWLARALPADGRLFTIELSSKHADIARQSYERAGVAERVTLIEGAALQTLPQLRSKAPFDLIFFDADPPNYVNYLSLVRDYLRPGGLLIAHNALQGHPDRAGSGPRADGMAAFNTAVAADTDFESVILPFGDGMLVALRL